MHCEWKQLKERIKTKNEQLKLTVYRKEIMSKKVFKRIIQNNMYHLKSHTSQEKMGRPIFLSLQKACFTEQPLLNINIWVVF